MNMTNRFNPRLKTVEISKIRNFDQQISSIPGIIKLTLGEPDFSTPEHVKQAGITAIEENYSHYTGMRGLPELCEAACAFQKKRYDLDYDPQTEVLTTVGATEAIAASLLAVLEEGDKVLIPAPAYPGYKPMVDLAGAELITLDTSETGFICQPEQLEAAFETYGESIKAIILNYPSNPTGTLLSAEQMIKLAEVIKQHPVFVISDEVYSELNYVSDHVSMATYLPEQTIVINGLSKSHAMTGWRIGFIFAQKYLIDEIIKVHQYLVTSATTNSQKAAVEALTAGMNDGAKMKERYVERRDYLLKELTPLGFHISQPDGAFYLFCKLPETITLNSWDFCLQLAEKGKVACIPGSAFGPEGEGFIRISYASSMAQLEEACRRIRTFLGK
ncbi:pyridoxal phosphate-dependent aminotransferase [Enterococcus durans]|uniref:pyridoxal phosphate-dependent aminotransferase n=1 Tax=Enterococcus durans TaxID=53345 RepID=UPI00232E4A65|nr:pyridoxal phosphate-dependent aminotransferase [Enterococcus durans]MDB1653829.1 pyridoxal phosphate-dependent aminotransferase [Enterococcus durans]MDB1656038.1 pyridoxal phosphate-dependent aminotransferase [Enterococcus durans]MDB1664258.1 pyridoxal phosphate-dependent aminotransferase [Enterococcus durans]MDB1669231.1 pyridoxal phosphate-dependent aminotransferase [Enterococcus durans]MDB1672154.1 pyridoxal phosphate-dependent aminotransferase [Enterococcus durans]